MVTGVPETLDNLISQVVTVTVPLACSASPRFRLRPEMTKMPVVVKLCSPALAA